MDANRWKRVQELFEAALERPVAERDAFLSDACAGDDDLRHEVASLLGADTANHSLFDGRAIDALGTLDEALYDLGEAPDDTPVEGQRVGPYRLLLELGRGGMGVVYLAERADDTFEQRVALKLIKRGMDSDEILQRFRAERQILARLRHPGIARLLDGGCTDAGRPYFAVEYVEGEPIDVYCDRRRLSIDARLQLFEQVCEAVQYAHRNLVVHRDLKPSNIQVAEENGVPHVKLLDFGIAKLLSDDEAGSLLVQTRTGVRVMTPEYAAPEQVRGEPPSTATDVYALGVLLYELLTGQRPYRIASRVRGEIEQAILEEEPERPSTAVTRAADAKAISQTRASEVSRLRKRLAGDLDMICLRALHKEPDRRYDSVALLVDDVRRHAGGLPVRARPDAPGYRLRKFVRRHRHSVAVAAGIVLLIAGTIGFYTAQLKQERDRAQAEVIKTQQVAAFLQSIFGSVDPAEAQGETVTARALLDAGAARIDEELADRPDVQAALLEVMGNAYHALDLFADADTLLARAVVLRRRSGGDPVALASSLNSLATLAEEMGRYEAADSLYRESLDLYSQARGPDDPAAGAVRSNLAALLQFTGHLDAADSLYARVLAVQRAAPELDPLALAQTVDHLGSLAFDRDDLDAAEDHYREALDLRRAVLTSPHPDVASSLNNLAHVLRHQARFDEAEPLYLEALAMRQALFEEPHADIAHTLNHLGRLYANTGDYVRAEAYAREALAMRIALFGEEHVEVTASLGSLAGTLSASGDYAGAAELYARALAINRRTFGELHPHVVALTYSLGSTRYRAGDPQGAEPLLREALDLGRRTLPEGHANTAYPLIVLGDLLVETERAVEAEPLLREAVAVRTDALGEDHWRTAVAYSALGRCLAALGHDAEAEPLLLNGYEHLVATHGTDDDRSQRALRRLVEFYDGRNRGAEADRYRASLH